MRMPSQDFLSKLSLALMLLLLALTFLAQAGMVGPRRRALQVPDEVEPFDAAPRERQAGQQTIT